MKSICKSGFALLLAAIMLILAAACTAPDTHDEPVISASDSQTAQDIPDSDTNTTVVHGQDGSLSITTTDADGNVIVTIDYDASSNITTKKEYEYDEYGTLLRELDYEGEGDLTAEFAAGNYDNAYAYGENNYDVHNDYIVSIDHAFDVTVEELAPLYEKAGQIYDVYGVAVLIADKVCDWTNGAELCFEYKKIEDCLALTESCLACYPDDFFRNLSDNGNDVTVCIQLVGTGASAGLYMGGYNYPLIQMDVNDYHPEEYDDKGDFFCYTLHHELFHMLGEKLLDKGAMTEEEWNSFNPDGFEYVNAYDDEKENELYLAGNNSEYFVYSYSCSTPGEDRSIIFGYAMTYYQGYGDPGFTEQIKAKLGYLSNCMRAGFNSEGWPEKAPWEQILDV